MAIPSSLDNLEWETPERKVLLIRAHPSPLKFMKHSNGNGASPSQVLEVELKEEEINGDSKIHEIYYDDGEMLSGSSVAAYYHGKLLIGTVFEEEVLLWDLGSVG